MSEAILLCVFEAVVKTSLGMIPFLAILLLLENAFQKQYSAVWKYSLCFLVLLRLLIPVYTGKDKNLTVDSLVPKMEVTRIQNLKKSEIETKKEKTYIIPDIPNITPLFMPNISISPISKQSSFFQKEPLKKTLAFVWLFVVIAKLFYLLIQYILFYQNVMRWRMLPCQKNTLKIYDVVCKEMKLQKAPSLFVCHAIASPMCFGFFRKGIYILKEELPEQKIKMIIQHELCHYQRKDLNYQLLCVIVSTLHFFNPFVLAFVKIAERNIELSCDTIVMENCSNEKRKQYSTMLWEMIKDSNSVLSNHFARREKWMKKRFENILDTAPKKKGTLLLCLFLLLHLLSYSFNTFAPEQQLTLLFYFFNLFVLFTFCFVMQIKEKRKTRFCAMLLLCFSINVFFLGCSQNYETEQSSPEQKQYSLQEVKNLFQWKTDYVGDNSAVGNLLSELGTPEGIKGNGFEIQSNTEPYGILVYYEIEDLEEEKRNMEIRKNTMILFSLIGNLDYVNYSISQKDKEAITLSFTREGMISEGAIVLIDNILEGYTDSADSYRYFLEFIEKTEQKGKEEQWKKEIENDLDRIVNNPQVALSSATQVYIDSSQESYYKIIEKGEQALYYLLEEFEKGNTEGLRGEIIKKICQEILKETVGKIPDTNPPLQTEDWYEDYKNNYHGVYPYYSSIVENISMGDSILMSNIKEVLTEVERKEQRKELTMMSLLIFSPPSGLKHQYHDVLKTNYYVKVKCYYFTMLEQNRGKILYLTGNHVIPVKISFEQKEDVLTLKEVRLKGKESLEIFCAEDEKIADWITEVSDFPSFLDNLEQELKDYVSKNEIKVDYYCIDGKTIMPF